MSDAWSLARLNATVSVNHSCAHWVGPSSSTPGCTATFGARRGGVVGRLLSRRGASAVFPREQRPGPLSLQCDLAGGVGGPLQQNDDRQALRRGADLVGHLPCH